MPSSVFAQLCLSQKEESDPPEFLEAKALTLPQAPAVTSASLSVTLGILEDSQGCFRTFSLLHFPPPTTVPQDPLGFNLMALAQESKKFLGPAMQGPDLVCSHGSYLQEGSLYGQCRLVGKKDVKMERPSISPAKWVIHSRESKRERCLLS